MVLWQTLISTSQGCFQADPSGTVRKEVLHAAETMRIMWACKCHFFKRMLVMLISFISCQLVCVSMRPKDLCILAFKTHAWGFACNILIFTVRACAPKKRAIKNKTLRYNFVRARFKHSLRASSYSEDILTLRKIDQTAFSHRLFYFYKMLCFNHDLNK